MNFKAQFFLRAIQVCRHKSKTIVYPVDWLCGGNKRRAGTWNLLAFRARAYIVWSAFQSSDWDTVNTYTCGIEFRFGFVTVPKIYEAEAGAVLLLLLSEGAIWSSNLNIKKTFITLMLLYSMSSKTLSNSIAFDFL